MTNHLKIYNTLKAKKENFEPLNPNKVGMYVCGMTVYDYCHIGHARILVVFDIIARHLRALGYDLTYVRNITDIDDKIIQRANQKNQLFSELTEYFIDKMNEDEDELGNIPPDLQPKATEHINEIIGMIQQLIENKMAYFSDNGTVYFETRKFENYGKLSGKKLDELRQGARIEIEEQKKDALDFVLWKPAKENEPSWDSPWGLGRPGWHIECSAMSCTHLGNHFDLHGGGGDLKFPHHENEIAQSVGATGKDFAQGWIHVGFVNVDNQKMSKSLNNFFTIREVFKHFHPEIVRYFLLSSHYRKSLNYSEKNLNLAKAGLGRLYSALRNDEATSIEDKGEVNSEIVEQFNQQMNDDFNTPKALSVLFDLVKSINKQKELNHSNELANLQTTLKIIGSRLGILYQNPDDFFASSGKNQEKNLDETKIKALIEKRNLARANKSFRTADAIRDELLAKNIVLEDKANKTLWRVVSK